MNTEETIHKSLEALNKHDAPGFAVTYAPATTVLDPQYDEPLAGRDAVRKDIEDLVRAFPDLQASVKTLLAQGDTYAAEIAFNGTHKGPFAGPDGELPATNRRVEFRGTMIGRVDKEGLVVEERRYFDLAGLMGQLGLT